MVFLRGPNQHDTWARFCAKHQAILAETGLPWAVLKSEAKFRELLETGATRAARTEATLGSLAEESWSAFEKFVCVFFHEFESYAPLDLFPAFRRESERRRAPETFPPS